LVIRILAGLVHQESYHAGSCTISYSKK